MLLFFPPIFCHFSMPFYKKYRRTVIVRELTLDGNGKVSTKRRKVGLQGDRVDQPETPSSSSTSQDLETLQTTFVQPPEPDQGSRYAELRMRQVGRWAELRRRLIDAHVEGEALLETCTICTNEKAVLRCRDCGPLVNLCEGCLETSHERLPFHYAEYFCNVRFLFSAFF